MAYNDAPMRNTAAAGYNDLSGALGSDIYKKLVDTHTYQRMTIAGWSTPRHLSGVMDIGATLKIELDAEVDVHPYQRNMTLEIQQPSLVNRELTFNSAFYYAVKVDAVDEDLPAVRRFMANLSKNAGKALGQEIEPASITKVMGGGIPQHNRGNAAGRDGNIELGTPAQPKVLDGDTIVNYIARAATVLQATPDGSEWNSGNMFILMPIISQVAWHNSKFADLCCDRRESLLTGGTLPNVAGFDIIFYDANVGQKANGNVTYPILFGDKDAVAFHQDLVKRDVNVYSERSFGRYTRGLMVYGVGLIWPKKVGLGFAQFTE